MSEESGEQSSIDREKLEEEAKERMEEMPAETALGNADPAGGGEGDPKDYKGNQGAP